VQLSFGNKFSGLRIPGRSCAGKRIKQNDGRVITEQRQMIGRIEGERQILTNSQPGASPDVAAREGVTAVQAVTLQPVHTTGDDRAWHNGFVGIRRPASRSGPEPVELPGGRQMDRGQAIPERQSHEAGC